MDKNRQDFEKSIKATASYQNLIYMHGEKLFIFDQGKYKIAAIQLAWEIYCERQQEVEQLENEWAQMDQELNQVNKVSFDVETENREWQKRVDAALEVLEKAKKLNSGNYLVGEFENVLKGPQSITFKAGDKVVNKSTEYLGAINEVSWISGNHMRLKGHDFCHVFVVDGFRHATQGEIAIGHRIDGVEK
ncbi:hypothetical protein [Acinetobacter pittii]|uniref:hypothetical protein n=1 Tax=Acinetobacter pittii TaxID=48296 RepID=UPI00226EC9F8|nr:hypothetical protein [Acinetobacter pittii]